MNGPDNPPVWRFLRTRRERRADYRYAERTVNGPRHTTANGPVLAPPNGPSSNNEASAPALKRVARRSIVATQLGRGRRLAEAMAIVEDSLPAAAFAWRPAAPSGLTAWLTGSIC